MEKTKDEPEPVKEQPKPKRHKRTRPIDPKNWEELEDDEYLL